MIAEIINKNIIEVYDLTQFDTDAIMHSGQVFRYFEKGDAYHVVSGANFARICSRDDKVIIESTDSDYFFNYFDLATDYSEIKNELLRCEKIRPAIEAGGGIRILRAGFAETVISFIISANNNIKRFTKTLNLLSERYGDRIEGGYYSFPTIKSLLAVESKEFKEIGCGYRDQYLVKAIQKLDSLDCNTLKHYSNKALDRELCGISGVGPKVCACIMLFCDSFHRLDVAPVDTWIRKALGCLTQNDRQTILDHKYAGVAQQYIFYYLQHLRREL